MATHDLHVAAAHAHGDGALGAAFVAVELAGEQRFEPDLVVFHFEQFELEALAFRKAALGRHQQEAGIGLGRDDPVFPWFRRLRRRGAGGSGKHRARRYQSRQNGHFHLLASSLSLSARQRPFIKIPVKAHALPPAARDCERPAPPLAMRTQDGSHHDSSGWTRPKTNARASAGVAQPDDRRYRRSRIGAPHPCGVRLRARARDRARLGARRRHHAHPAHLSVDRGDYFSLYQVAGVGRFRAIVRQIYFADLAGDRAHGRDPGLSVAGASPLGDLCARRGRHQDREGSRGPRRRRPGMGANRRHLRARLSRRGGGRRSRKNPLVAGRRQRARTRGEGGTEAAGRDPL